MTFPDAETPSLLFGWSVLFGILFCHDWVRLKVLPTCCVRKLEVGELASSTRTSWNHPQVIEIGSFIPSDREGHDMSWSMGLCARILSISPCDNMWHPAWMGDAKMKWNFRGGCSQACGHAGISMDQLMVNVQPPFEESANMVNPRCCLVLVFFSGNSTTSMHPS